MKHSFEIGHLSVFVDSTGKVLAYGTPENLLGRVVLARNLTGFIDTIVSAADIDKRYACAKEIKILHYSDGKLTVEFSATPQDTIQLLRQSEECRDALSGQQAPHMRAVPASALDEAIRLLEAKYTTT